MIRDFRINHILIILSNIETAFIWCKCGFIKLVFCQSFIPVIKIVSNIYLIFIRVACMFIAVVGSCDLNLLGFLKEYSEGDFIQQGVPYIIGNFDFSRRSCAVKE